MRRRNIQSKPTPTTWQGGSPSELGDIDGLVRWYRVEDVAAASGTQFSSWPDASNCNKSATQSVFAAQPYVAASGPGGYRFVGLDTGDDWMQLGPSAENVTVESVAAVILYTTYGGPNSCILGNAGNDWKGDGGSTLLAATSNAKLLNGYGTTDGASLVLNSTLVKPYPAWKVVVLRLSDPLTFDSIGNGIVEFGGFKLAELRLYNIALGNSEILTLHAELRTKYSI